MLSALKSMLGCCWTLKEIADFAQIPEIKHSMNYGTSKAALAFMLNWAKDETGMKATISSDACGFGS